MKELLKQLNQREEELWEMKAQIPGLPEEFGKAALRKIEAELSQLSRKRMAIAMGKAA